VVLGVEKRATAKLQDPRTLRKLVKLDDHVALAFAGLNADARVAIDSVGCLCVCVCVCVWLLRKLTGVVLQLRVECLSHKLTVDVPPTVKAVARFAGRMQQRYVFLSIAWISWNWHSHF